MKLAFPSFFRSRMLRDAIATAAAAILLSLASPALAQSKITLTITPPTAAKVYAADDPASLFYTQTGKEAADTFEDIFGDKNPVKRAPGEDVGEYAYMLDDSTLTAFGRGKYELKLSDTVRVFTITPKEVTYITTEANKIYDGEAAGPTNFGGAFAAGDIETGDTVRPSGGMYAAVVISPDTFPAGSAGMAIVISDVGLAGANGANYMLSAASRFAGDITPLEVVYTSRSADKQWDNETYPPSVWSNRSRDGSGDAPYASSIYAEYGGEFETGGVVEGDMLCISGGAFTQTGLGDDVRMTAFTLGGPVGEEFTLAGSAVRVCTPGEGDSRNYTLSGHSIISGDITRRSVSVSQGNLITKVYDGATTSDFTSTRFTEVRPDSLTIVSTGYNSPHVNAAGLPGDELSCLSGATTCADDDKPAFKINLTLAAGSAEDDSQFYTLSQTTLETRRGNDFVASPAAGCCHVRITPKEVTLSDVQFTKEYDGGDSIAGARVTATVNGLAGDGQSFTLRVKDGADAEFADVNVGGSINITGLGADDLELVSASATSFPDNYSLPSSGITAAGTITKRQLCIIVRGESDIDSAPTPRGAELRTAPALRILTNDLCKTPFAGHTIRAGGITFVDSVALRGITGNVAPVSLSTLKLSETAPSNNYELDYRGGQWYFTRADTTNVLLVSPTSGFNRVYGDPAPEFAYSVAPQTGSVYASGDDANTAYFTASPLRVTDLGVGVHAFSLDASPAYAAGIDTKYDFLADPAARHAITRRPVDIKANVFQVFNTLADAQAAVAAGTLKFTVDGLATGENAGHALNGQLGLAANPDADGNYAITIGSLMARANYQIASFTSQLAIINMEKPPAPTITSLLKSSKDGQPALEVRWEAGDGVQPVFDWNVNYKLDSETNFPANALSVNSGLSATARSHIIPALSPGVAYDVVVYARSSGTTPSDNSAAVTLTTHATPPAAALSETITAGVSAGKTTNTISWEYDGSTDAARAYYLQVVDFAGNFASATTIGHALPAGVDFILNAAANGGTLRGLEGVIAYKVRVFVAAASGLLSTASNEVRFTGAQVPSRLPLPDLEAARSGELAASWDAPTSAGAPGSRIIRYDVRWRTAAIAGPVAAGAWNAENGVAVAGAGGHRQHTITGLSGETLYDVQVRAANQVAAASWSRLRQKKTIKRASGSDASLASLTLNAPHTLAPDFNGQVLSYSITVANTVTEVTLTPTVTETLSRMIISIGGGSTGPHNSGDPKTVPLSGALTHVVLTVTSQDGTQILQYRVSIIRSAGAPSLPTNPMATAGARDGELNVTWGLPLENNGAEISGYTVRWKLASVIPYDAADVKQVAATPTPGTILTGLTPEVEYDVQVLATNSAGSSAYTTAMQGTPPAPSDNSALFELALKNNADDTVIPLTPAVFAADTTAYTASVHNRIDSVKLFLTTAHAGATISITDGTTPQMLGVSSESTPFALAQGDNTLTITVTAEDTSTTTDYVVTVERRGLPPDAPAAPSLAAGPTKLDVTWTAPGDNGSAITGYRVRWAETGTTAWIGDAGATGQDTGGTDTTYTITSLTNGTTYDVQVAALSSAGDGEFSAAATATPQANDATLLLLVATDPDSQAITLEPSFSGTTESYSATVESPIASLQLRAVPTVSVDSISLTLGSDAPQTLTADTPSAMQALKYGENLLVVVVTAEDTTTTKTYRLSVTRNTGAPGAPAAPTVAPAIESLVVNWSSPAETGGSNITGYLLRWGKTAPNPIWINTNDAAGQSVGVGITYTIPGLEVGESHDVQVAAVNLDDGAGAWSATTSGTPVASLTDADLRALSLLDSAGNPVMLDQSFDRAATTYTASVPTEITSVLFTATYHGDKLVIGSPDDNNSPDSKMRSDPVALTIGANVIELVVTSRDRNVMKTYTLTLTRAAGVPDQIAVPTAQASDAAAKGMIVNWVWDGSGNNGSAHIGFAVRVRLKAATAQPDNTWQPTNDGRSIGDALARTALFTDLEPVGGRYEAQVVVISAIGRGAWSDSGEGRVSGPPDAPVLVAPQGKAGRLSVSWSAPAFTGAPGVAINAYHVRWRESDTDADTAGEQPGKWQALSGDSESGESISAATSYDITGLNGGTQYDVEVRAANSFAGDNIGAWSETQKGTPTKMMLTITPGAATKVYGAEDPLLTYTADFEGSDLMAAVFESTPYERAPGETVAEYGYTLKSVAPFKDKFAGKYTLAPLAGDNKFAITAKEVVYASTTADKIYDSKTAAPADLGGSFTSGVVVATVNGVSIDDSNRLSVSGGVFADKLVGDDKTVTGFMLGGDAADNYSLASSSSVTGDITALATTLTATVADRVYDGTTAVGSISTAFSPTILSGDDVTADTGSAVFGDANVGNAKSIVGLSTSGADVANYAITIVATANVLKRPLRVAAAGSGILAPDAAALADHSLLTIASGVDNEGLVSTHTAAGVLTGSIALGTRDPASGPGRAPLTQGTLLLQETAPGKNYDLSFTPGFYTFTDPGKQTLIVTPQETGREYGGTDPEFTYTVMLDAEASFIGDDTATTTYFTASPVTRTLGDDAGAYPFALLTSPAYAEGIEAKYTLLIAPGAQYTITPKELTVGGTLTLSKVYDGNTTVADTALSGGDLMGVVDSESFTLELATGSDGAYADANVAGVITLNDMTGADLALVGADAASKPANYTLAEALNANGVITAKAVTVTAAVLSKTYDGNTGFSGSSIKSGSGVVTGAISGESLTLTATAGDYASADVGTPSVSGAVLALSGGNTASKAENYALQSVVISGEITPKEVTVGDVTVTKTYDNTDSMAGVVVSGGAVGAAVGTQSFTLQLTGDNDGVYAGADASSNAVITGADFELVGADEASKPANYTMPALTLIGVIEPKVVMVAAVTLQKSYDGLNAATAGIASVLGGEVTDTIDPHALMLQLASSGDITYASTAVGDDIALTDADRADFELFATTGNAANYQLPATITALGSIVPREVDVAEVTLTKQYDGKRVAEGVSLSGGAITDTAQSDMLTLAVSGGVYSTADVASNLAVDGALFTLQAVGGADAANYVLPAQIVVVGVIEPKVVSVTTPSLVKNYDGTSGFGDTRLVTGGGVVGDLIGADSLILAVTGAVYASSEVGMNIAISEIAWELGDGEVGSRANYALPPDIIALTDIATGEIVAKPITLIATSGATSKIYDGGVTAPSGLVVGASAGDILAGDAAEVRFEPGEYNSKNVREANVITVTSAGSKAGNYAPSGSGIAAEITPKPVGVTLGEPSGPKTKVYDGTTAAPAGFSVTGSLTEADVIEADRGKVLFGATASGVYNSKNVGEADRIQVVFVGGLSEDESGNYIGDASAAVTGASITARPLKVTADSVSTLVADKPEAADLTYTLEQGISGEGLAGDDSAADVLSGALAYGAPDSDGRAAIEQGSLMANANYEVTFTAGVFVPSGMLDVDKSGKADGTDGIIIARYLLGMRGDLLIANLTVSDGAPGTVGAITKKLDDLHKAGTLNVDGNSRTTAADGIIIARYLLGVVSGEALVQGQAATGKADSVKATMDSLVPEAAPAE